MQRRHVCVKKYERDDRKKQHQSKRAILGKTMQRNKNKMEAQWIVELTSSGRVGAVKKGPFPLIIYFPIRHSPARGKHTFI